MSTGSVFFYVLVCAGAPTPTRALAPVPAPATAPTPPVQSPTPSATQSSAVTTTTVPSAPVTITVTASTLASTPSAMSSMTTQASGTSLPARARRSVVYVSEMIVAAQTLTPAVANEIVYDATSFVAYNGLVGVYWSLLFASNRYCVVDWRTACSQFQTAASKCDAASGHNICWVGGVSVMLRGDHTLALSSVLQW
jgi:hypothetical protein